MLSDETGCLFRNFFFAFLKVNKMPNRLIRWNNIKMLNLLLFIIEISVYILT